MIHITPDELTGWARLVNELCGVQLDATKGYLIETRLGALLAETGSTSYQDLLNRVRLDATRALRRRVIDAITTNETSFFRDLSPFELLRHKLLPELIDRRRQATGRPPTLRIWSAACSTGQEVYSTAIVLKELLGDLRRYDVRLLGTDISNQAVAKASLGIYSELELSRGLPPVQLARHFTRQGNQWKIADELRALATFRNMNLLEAFSFPAPFDLIFCRNVAIYFSESDRRRLFSSLGRCLAPDGALLIGSTEALTGLCPEFEARRYLRSVFYEKRKAPAPGMPQPALGRAA
jgi:chemotaxis protein methyltransferase CheR